MVAACTAFVLWRGAALILAGAMTVGALTVFLAYLSKFFKPVQDLAKMTNTVAQTAVGLERIQAILDSRQRSSRTRPMRATPARPGRDRVRARRLRLRPRQPVLQDVNFRIEPGQMRRRRRHHRRR